MHSIENGEKSINSVAIGEQSKPQDASNKYEEISELLEGVDVNYCTPLEALGLLSELVQKVKK